MAQSKRTTRKLPPLFFANQSPFNITTVQLQYNYCAIFAEIGMLVVVVPAHLLLLPQIVPLAPLSPDMCFVRRTEIPASSLQKVAIFSKRRRWDQKYALREECNLFNHFLANTPLRACSKFLILFL